MDPRGLIPHVPRLLLEWEIPLEGPYHLSVDGTMAFVDISGFTAMSERLARLGKQGAEEVSDVINSIFSRLLGVAYENGGSLIKFGGDALLLFFTGPEHAQRAAHAAAWMRRRLREIGKIRTSAGIAGLRMHVGLHSGPFDLFFGGDAFRDLVIAGPHATRTVEMESAAVAGEIAVSEGTAAHLPPAVLGEEREGGALLVRTPRPPLVYTDVSVPEDADPSPFIPPRMREFLAGPTDPEHRRVGVAFIRFQGVDELMQREGPEATAATLDELMRIVHHAVERNGLTYIDNDAERDGGKFMIVSGAPSASERDGEILLRAAREIVESDPPLPVRIGVNLGPAFAGPIGPAYRRKYTVMGDTVNLAARLMARAEPGQVIAMPSVLERSRPIFRTTPLEPFSVKGKAKPIEALDVGELVRMEEETSSQTRLIGRRAELQRLTALLDDALSRTGHLVEIVGEPGLGKSRLTEEVRWLATRFTVFSTMAEQYERAMPYSSMRGLLRRVLGIDVDATAEDAGRQLLETLEGSVPDLVPWAPLIAAATDSSVPPTPEVTTLSDEFKSERLRRVVLEALEVLASDPTLFVIEDAHWLDAASAELVREIGARISTRPWVLLITRRPGDFAVTADLPSEIVELGPLGPEDAADIVRAIAPDISLAPHELARLSERAGGNPLFLQELAQAVLSGEGLEGLPDTVEAVIGTRIDHLGANDRALLRTAAVLGASFTTELLQELVAEGGSSRNLSRLADLPDFVVEEWPGTWRFRHALIRDVAYEALPFRRRADLHRRAGEAIERHAGGAPEDLADTLCLHFHRAKDFERAWRYAVVAGRRALEKFAVAEAADYYRLALDAGKRLADLDPGELSSVAEALGDACERLGAYGDAMTAYRTARTLTRGRPPRPPLFLKEGVLRLRLGRYPQALRWYRRGLGLGGEAGSPDDVELGLAYAGVRYYQGHYRECIAWCERMAATAEAIGDRAGLAHAYSLLYLAHTHLGSEERVRYRDLALPLYEEVGDLTGQANVLNNLGIDAYYEGEWDEALSLYRRSRDLQERTGNAIFVADTDNNIAEILSDQGRLEEAEQLFRRSLETYRAARYAMGEAFAVGNLGRVAARTGRLDEATTLLEDALDRQRTIGDERNLAEVEARLAEVSIFAGMPEEALPRIASTLETVDRLGGMAVLRAMLLRLEGYARGQLGDTDAARSVFESSLETAQRAGATYEAALTLEGLAWLLEDAPGGSSEAARARAARKQARQLFGQLGVVSTPAVGGKPSGRRLGAGPGPTSTRYTRTRW